MSKDNSQTEEGLVERMKEKFTQLLQFLLSHPSIQIWVGWSAAKLLHLLDVKLADTHPIDLGNVQVPVESTIPCLLQIAHNLVSEVCAKTRKNRKDQHLQADENEMGVIPFRRRAAFMCATRSFGWSTS